MLHLRARPRRRRRAADLPGAGVRRRLVGGAVDARPLGRRPGRAGRTRGGVGGAGLPGRPGRPGRLGGGAGPHGRAGAGATACRHAVLPGGVA
jgi:hypothetical protein